MQMSVHEEVDLEWRNPSIYQLNEYLTLQLKGARTCLQSVLEAVEIEQPLANFDKLNNFLIQSYEVLKRYCRVCLQSEHLFILPMGASGKCIVIEYVQEDLFLLQTICSNFHKLVNRRFVYLLLRILCKIRMKLESYLVAVDYWGCNSLPQ